MRLFPTFILLLSGLTLSAACARHAPAQIEDDDDIPTLDAPAAALAPAARLNALRQGVRASVDNLEKKLADPNIVVTTRDLSNGALSALMVDDDTQRAEMLLRRTFALQNRDPNSPNYGAFPWETARTSRDPNAVEFAAQGWGTIWFGYRDKLSPALRAEFLEAARAALPAIRRHPVKVDYTNIYLMKMVNLINLGQIVGDESAIEEGRAMLDNWLSYTRDNGIHEFNSPTYYTVNLNCLALGALQAPDAPTRERFRGALQLMWNDMAANYFAPARSVVGPQSRNYNFLFNSGGLDAYYAVAGWPLPPNFGGSLERVALLVAAQKGVHDVSAETREISLLPERTVRSKWGDKVGQERYHYLTPDYAVGSTSADYGSTSKIITVNLAASKALPALSVLVDDADAPYGKIKVTGKNGHPKAWHEALGATVAQEKGALLALLDLEMDRVGPKEIPSLATNVLLPVNADAITLDGAPVELGETMRIPVSGASVIGVRAGQSGVAIRIFRADGAGGQTPRWVLQADPDGFAAGAARLTAYHFQGDAPRALGPDLVRAGLIIVARRCETDADFCGAATRRQKRRHYRKRRWQNLARHNPNR